MSQEYSHQVNLAIVMKITVEPLKKPSICLSAFSLAASIMCWYFSSRGSNSLSTRSISSSKCWSSKVADWFLSSSLRTISSARAFKLASRRVGSEDGLELESGLELRASFNVWLNLLSEVLRFCLVIWEGLGLRKMRSKTD